MHAAIRQYTVEGGKMDEMSQDIRENFVPLISQVPGFVSYDVLNAGDRLVTVSVFDTKEGADESTRRAAEYVKQNPKFQSGFSKPEITQGELTVHKAAERGVGAPYTR
jgi:heme-degrading monooxygenase HmoA